MWHVGMRLIGQPSPGRCESAMAGFAGPDGLFPMSPDIRPELSAGDGERDRTGKAGPDSAGQCSTRDLSPPCRRQSAISPGRSVR